MHFWTRNVQKFSTFSNHLDFKVHLWYIYNVDSMGVTPQSYLRMLSQIRSFLINRQVENYRIQPNHENDHEKSLPRHHDRNPAPHDSMRRCRVCIDAAEESTCTSGRRDGAATVPKPKPKPMAMSTNRFAALQPIAEELAAGVPAAEDSATEDPAAKESAAEGSAGGIQQQRIQQQERIQ